MQLSSMHLLFLISKFLLFGRGCLCLWRGKNIHKVLMRTAEELRAKRKKQLKKDTASKIKSLVDEVFSIPQNCCRLHRLHIIVPYYYQSGDIIHRLDISFCFS